MPKHSNLLTWHRAHMREDLGKLSTNDPVFIIQSSIVHTHPGMGKTYWIMHRTSPIFAQVADTNFGAQLYKLLMVDDPVILIQRQEKLTLRIKALLTDSAYSPKNRKNHTYFWGNRPVLIRGLKPTSLT